MSSLFDLVPPAVGSIVLHPVTGKPLIGVHAAPKRRTEQPKAKRSPLSVLSPEFTAHAGKHS
jgi:hypothetical protein